MKLEKKFGQNFLIDELAIKKFIHFCNLKNQDTVLEIGPGNGSLSKLIASNVNKVIGIEIDPIMAYEIQKLQITNYKLQIDDFLKLELKKLIEDEKITKIVGAIPYYISSPIIHKILRESTINLKEINLITQKEFAEKVIGKINKRSYFTNLVENYGEIEKGDTIKKESFNPVPKVNSMYFKIKVNKYPANQTEFNTWSKFLHHVFKTPRKKLNKRFEKKLLNELQIGKDLRPGNLNLKELNSLYLKYKI